MIYHDSICELFLHILKNKQDFLESEDFHKARIPAKLADPHSPGEYPDDIMYDGAYLERKSSKKGGNIMFNSTPPCKSCYYLVRWGLTKQLILVNGVFWTEYTKEEFLFNIYKIENNDIFGEENINKNKEKIMEKIGKSFHLDGLNHRFRSMAGGNNEIFKIAPKKRVSLIICIPPNHDKKEIEKNINSKLGIKEKDLYFSDNIYSVTHKPNPFLKGHTCIIYSEKI